MSRTLVMIGVVLIVIGLLWPVIQKTGLGRLPGDIVIKRENFSFYFPVTSMIVVSVVVSALVSVFFRFFR